MLKASQYRNISFDFWEADRLSQCDIPIYEENANICYLDNFISELNHFKANRLLSFEKPLLFFSLSELNFQMQ